MSWERLRQLIAWVLAFVALFSFPQGLPDAWNTLQTTWGLTWAFFSDGYRWISLLIFVGAVLYLRRQHKLSRTPIRSFQSHYCFKLSDNCDSCEVARDQWILTSSPRVAGYRSSSRPDCGEIPEDKISAQLLMNGEVISNNSEDQLLKFGTPESGWEFFQQARKGALPYCIGYEFLPDWVWTWGARLGFLESFFIKRIVKTTEVGEYNRDAPGFRIRARSYSHKNLSFEIKYNQESVSGIRAWIAGDSAIRPVQIKIDSDGPDKNHSTASGKVNSLDKHQELVVMWRFTRLDHAQAR